MITLGCAVGNEILQAREGAEIETVAGGVQRQPVDLAVVVEPLARADHPQDLDRLTGALNRQVEADTVPAFRDLRAG